MRRFIPVGESADALIRINGYPLKNLALVTEVDVIDLDTEECGEPGSYEGIRRAYAQVLADNANGDLKAIYG